MDQKIEKLVTLIYDLQEDVNKLKNKIHEHRQNPEIVAELVSDVERIQQKLKKMEEQQ
ncbi:hypothetical protein NOM01_06035 [Sporolactobacillus sp. STSJ-5]|uniref:hypothetical protein n=1 Tax=Sporolactobacillus sp. STSJ-5 TaxID=2965076 RepID=UPI002104086B|nr:hypothetical protein [Sporolactobacillus sp. STSJ-5]MCQ2009558.1 hypothetical protein [Sporolactobacillus sp. STSJ-5]